MKKVFTYKNQMRKEDHINAIYFGNEQEKKIQFMLFLKHIVGI